MFAVCQWAKRPADLHLGPILKKPRRTVTFSLATSLSMQPDNDGNWYNNRRPRFSPKGGGLKLNHATATATTSGRKAVNIDLSVPMRWYNGNRVNQYRMLLHRFQTVSFANGGFYAAPDVSGSDRTSKPLGGSYLSGKPWASCILPSRRN